MPEIARTAIGRNALVLGLIGHAAAILVGMLPATGSGAFFQIVYPFSCLALMAGAYAELNNLGCPPLTEWRFYLSAAASIVPVLGPCIVLGLLYSWQGNDRITGILPAMLSLNANLLLVSALIIFLLLLFAFAHVQNDPYYLKNRQHGIQQNEIKYNGSRNAVKSVGLSRGLDQATKS